MSTLEDPLNEVSLNTPLKSNTMSWDLTSKLKGTHTLRDTSDSKYIQDSFQLINEFVHVPKYDKPQRENMHKLLINLYQSLIKIHCVPQIKLLIRNHLMIIGKYLNDGHFSDASIEIISLYNSSNPYKAQNLSDILLSDIFKYNQLYISTLKILILQIIIKTKSYDKYELLILKLFANDQRYLLNDPKLKIQTLIKLLLNCFSSSTSYKTLFGLKFLQYISQFNLKFENFIKKLNEAQFKKQLIIYSTKCIEINLFLNSYYLNYSKHCQNLGKLMLTDIINRDKIPKMSIRNIDDLINFAQEDHEYNCLSFQDMDSFVKIANSFLESETVSPDGKLRTLNYIWKVIYSESFDLNIQQKILFDKTLNCINKNVKETNSIDILQFLHILRDICINHNELKRLSNLVNVIFNISILNKDSNTMLLSADIDIFCLMSYTSCQINPPHRMTQKLEKFLKGTSDMKVRNDLFSRYFNIFIMSDIQDLGDLIIYGQYFQVLALKRLKLNHSVNISECSEIMTAILSSGNNGNNGENIKIESWNSLTILLYSCLNGCMDTSINMNEIQNKYHFLYKYEILLKSVYFFNVEMNKHSTKNIPQIVSAYTSKWVSKHDVNEKVSAFECEFIKNLYQYLLFINFNKISLELVEIMKSKKCYFEKLSLEITKFELNSLINLQIPSRINITTNKIGNLNLNINSMKLDALLIVLDIQLNICVWNHDVDLFRRVFQGELLEKKAEIFDINNVGKLPFSSSIKILLFNIKLYVSASELHLYQNNVISAITESKKAVKLAASLIKSQNRLSQSSRLVLIQALIDSYINLITVHIRTGLSRDTEFYTREMSKVISELGEPPIVFKSLHFLHEYYSITEQNSIRDLTLQKANKVFDFINGEQDINSLTMFLYDNCEYDRLQKSLHLYFGEKLSETCFPQYWKVRLGEVLPEEQCVGKLLSLNSVNYVNSTYKRVLNHLEYDIFFKSVFESALAIPSIKPISKELLHSKKLSKLMQDFNDSPRSSNMTPRSKHMKQKSDRIAAINMLNQILDSMEKLDVTRISHTELYKVSSIYSLCSVILSNISSATRDNLTQKFYLSDLTRCLPQYFDKLLSSLDKSLSQNFELLPLESFKDEMKREQAAILNAQTEIRQDDQSPFNVISIDICSVSGDLLLSKFDPRSKDRIYLTIPLNGRNARDLDSLHLSFNEAIKELREIIEESNMSVSKEVTSKITSSDGRRAWWEQRYAIDKRLQTLLEKIERTWFGGFKGFFSHKSLNNTLFIEFKDTFFNVLHQNLPSRKQVGTSSSFIQIEDWIIELFLQINVYDDNFLLMMEDLIYFVLDILLYHGEENAYDEIDINVLHFQLEEAIKKYHSKNENIEKRQEISHTFLIISSQCHLFPWESLSFLKQISTTRVPSFNALHQLLLNNGNHAKLKISLGSNISMILNPNGDLQRTEERFAELFNCTLANAPNSKLIIHDRPTEDNFLKMLSTSNLFIFVGHGGGEQYVRNREIKRYNRLAPSFLLGCSSASMKYYGKLEPTGVIYSYLLGGSPLVLGNLWDVTDKDIDKFSKRLFEKIGFIKDVTTEISGYKTITEAVNESRDVCHLRYLNGAAPILYGLPADFI